MITREFNLYLHAGHSIPLVINCNQYDQGEQWLFTLFNADGTQYVPSSGAIVGIKSDNLGIINSGTVDSQGRVVINETQQMTAAVGKAVFELVIDDGTHGTANFVVLVEEKPGNNADLSETDISMIEEAIEAASSIKPYGSPLVASTVAGMTDHDKVYVYVGSETGYTSGNWYYWDGSAWASGGVYNSVAVQTDTTLTLSGVAADAKKTGDEISDLKSQITNSMPREVKLALDAMLLNMVVKDDDVFRDEYNAFHAWATSVNLLSISAVFDSGTDTIYTDDSLDNLKQYLTVTASYDDGTSSAVSGYTLSGELTEGTSQITVSYNDKTASFNVTVVAPLYKVPNLDVTTTYDGRTNHITNTDGLFTISGTGYHVSAIGKNGTVQINHHTEEWFTFSQGDNVVFEVYDITWQNNAGADVNLACKWGQSTSDSNVGTATFTMASGQSGTGGTASFVMNPYTNNRSISGFVIQLTNNTGNGCNVSFRMKLFVNGVRYF